MNNLSMAFEQFIDTGDFLSITRQFEKSITYQCNFALPNAKVSLLDTGVLVVEPKVIDSSTKDIVISSGIHGNETAPIEIVNRLVRAIIQDEIQVKNRTLFIIGNPVAMNISKRFEVENLNRLFCGKYKNIVDCYEKERAEKLEQYVGDFYRHKGSHNSRKYHYDLHTAIRESKYEKFAIYPFQDKTPWDKCQLEFLLACGVNTILFGHAPSGTFSYFSSATFQAHAFTVELGKVKAFGENDMTNFEAIENSLRQLIEDRPVQLTPFDNSNFTLFEVLGDITKSSDDFIFHVADDVSNFTDFPIGTLISEDGEKQYRTKNIGESIVFPNANVSNGQRAGLMVVPTKI
mgnify:CR=1 FL=1